MKPVAALRTASLSLAFAASLLLSACEKKSPTPTPTAANTSADDTKHDHDHDHDDHADHAATPATGGADAAALPAGLFLADAPANPANIKDAKPAAKTGEKVTLIGRIGGSVKPFVDGRAIFTIVDTRVKYCGETDPEDDHCKTPWDYCCEPRKELAANMATVEILDASGAPIKANVNGANGLEPLTKVIIVGTVTDASAGNLILRAEGIHVAGI